jgi:tetratricopeptide (TPR) repeat protein
MARGGAARAWRRAAGFAAAGAACLAVVFLEIPAGTEDPFQDRLHLGAAYRQAGRLEEAERVFRETIRDAEDLLARHGWTRGSPVFPAGVTFRLALHAAHRDLAGILADQGRLDEAIEQYVAAIPSDPNDVDLYARLGGAHRKKGEFAAAARAYERGLAVEPGSFVLRFDLATALYEAGDPRAALAELLRAGEALPRLPPLDQADWHYGMGTVLHAIPGREAEAIAHFREALRRNPSHPQAVEVRRILGASR